VLFLLGSTFLGVGDGCCWCVDVGSVESEWRIEVLLGLSCIVTVLVTCVVDVEQGQIR
jgi:hypothetical protein